MFFSISHTLKDNFSHHYELGAFKVSTDAGWKFDRVDDCDVLYKGYADDSSLESLLHRVVVQKCPTYTGNFCVMVYKNKSLTIKTDVYRAFPIYTNDTEINNLIKNGPAIWSDSVITISENLTYTEEKFDIIGSIDSERLSHQQGIEKLESIIATKTKKLLTHNTLPVKTFLSGGVDSLLTYSYLQKHTSNFTLIDYNHVEWDEFYMKNSEDLQQYWAYKQIHHWKEPCLLTVGSPGDEYMMRSPTTANLYLLSKGTSIPEINTNPKNLQYSYFNRDKNIKSFKQQSPLAVSNNSELVTALCNILANDWQHWHLGNTLTWTPLRDLRVFKTILQMPEESIRSQILDSGISKELIERNAPGLSSLISDQKNTGNVFANLCDFILAYQNRKQ